MKTSPTRTPLEEIRRHQMSMTPGSLSGRVAEARPIWNSNLDASESASEEADSGTTNLVQFWYDQFLVTAPGTQRVTLTHLPLDHSEHLYWGPIYQRNAFWTRSAGSRAVIIPDPSGHLSPGDVLTFKYAYIPGVPSDESAPGWVADPVGLTGVWGNQTSITVPSGTQSGDLMVLVMGAVGSFATASSTDSRFTDSRSLPTSDGLANAYWGYSDGSGSPVSISLGGIVASAAALAVFKSGGQYLSETVVAWGGAAPAVPNVDAAISLLVNIAPSSADFPGTPETNYTIVGGASQVQAIVSVGYWNGPGTAPATAFNHSKDGGVILGINT